MKIYAQSELIAQYISGMAVTLVCQQCGQTAAAAAQPRLSWNTIIIVVVAVNGFDTLAWCEQNMRSLLWFITLFIFGACLIMYTKCSNAFTITTKATTTETTVEAEVKRNNNNCSCNTHRGGGSVAGEQQLRQRRRRNSINKTRPLRCCCSSVVDVGVAGD